MCEACKAVARMRARNDQDWAGLRGLVFSLPAPWLLRLRRKVARRAELGPAPLGPLAGHEALLVLYLAAAALDRLFCEPPETPTEGE